MPNITRGQAIDDLYYPAACRDQRISTTERDGTLLIRVRRVSTFWQPATLFAVVLVEAPILVLAFALGIWELHGITVDHPGHYGGPSLAYTAAILGIATTVLLVTILAAIKGATITAKPRALTTRTTFFVWSKRRMHIPADDIISFGVRQSAIYDSIGGAVPFRDLAVETKSRGRRSALRTCRLSQQQVGALATRLRQFYGI